MEVLEVGINVFFIVMWLQTFEVQGMECDDLNYKGPQNSHSLMVDIHLMELFGKD